MELVDLDVEKYSFLAPGKRPASALVIFALHAVLIYARVDVGNVTQEGHAYQGHALASSLLSSLKVN